MKRSTFLMVYGGLVAQPLLWIDHPLETLGMPLIYLVVAVSVISSMAGLVFWKIDGQ